MTRPFFSAAHSLKAIDHNQEEPWAGIKKKHFTLVKASNS
jgi:hypothetical protein